MQKKTTLLLLVVLLTSMHSTFLNTEKAWASGTIYIRPDGSIDPPSSTINRAGDIYTFTASIYETIVIQKDNIIVDGNGYTLQGAGSGAGFDLSNRNNVTIENTRIVGWYYGVHLYSRSTGNTIRNSNLTSNSPRAIFISNSSDNTILDNSIVNNSNGIFLWRTNTTVVRENNVSNNGEDGVSVGYMSFNNVINNNTLANNGYAGVFLGYETPALTSNVITYNNIADNIYAGIHLDHMSGNTIHHNNLIDNERQVVTVGATNTWDDGYPSGGNYWSDYTGFDLNWGPYQDKIGSDGIGDTPHILDEDNLDYYPLMSPYEYWSNPTPGDINKDTNVDNDDLSQLAIAYGSTPEKPNWNPNSDINSDNTVNVPDLFRLGKNFGKTADTTAQPPDSKTTASTRWR